MTKNVNFKNIYRIRFQTQGNVLFGIIIQNSFRRQRGMTIVIR